MKARVTNQLPQFITEQEKRSDVIALTIATDIHRVSSMNAPRDKGTLVRSGRIVKRGTGFYSIVFGGGPVKYAKRRHYENKKNPSSLRYLQRAGDSISRNFRRYYEATK